MLREEAAPFRRFNCHSAGPDSLLQAQESWLYEEHLPNGIALYLPQVVESQQTSSDSSAFLNWWIGPKKSDFSNISLETQSGDFRRTLVAIGDKQCQLSDSELYQAPYAEQVPSDTDYTMSPDEEHDDKSQFLLGFTFGDQLFTLTNSQNFAVHSASSQQDHEISPSKDESPDIDGSLRQLPREGSQTILPSESPKRSRHLPSLGIHLTSVEKESTSSILEEINTVGEVHCDAKDVVTIVARFPLITVSISNSNKCVFDVNDLSKRCERCTRGRSNASCIKMLGPVNERNKAEETTARRDEIMILKMNTEKKHENMKTQRKKVDSLVL